jgi:hypothetical protein
MRRNERAALARVLGIGVKVLSGERKMRFAEFSTFIENSKYAETRREDGTVAVTRADIEIIAAVEALEAVAPFFRDAEYASSMLKYVCRVDSWRRFLGESRGWEADSAGQADKDGFAAAASRAIRTLVRPWVASKEDIDPLGPRLLAVFWNAFLAVYYAQRGDDPDADRVALYAERCAHVFETARAIAQSRLESQPS